MANSAFLTAAGLQVLDLTIVGSFTLFSFIILRFFWHHMPRKYLMPMWLMAGIRLMVPISIESPASTIPEDMPGLSQELFLDMQSITLPSAAPEQLVSAAESGLRLGSVLSMVWLAGLTLMLLWAIVSVLLLKRRMACATPLGDGVYECDSCASPFVLGFFRPKIYLPYGLDDQQRELILSHERSHIKRLDHIIKPLGWLVLAVHWFNPIVWAGYIRFCKDIERDCDERTIDGLDSDQRRAYSRALLELSAGEKIFSQPLAFGELDTKWRIQRVLGYKKPARYLAVLGVIGIIIMAVTLMTDPKDSENASSIGIIGGADGPTSVFVSTINGDALDYKSYIEAAENTTWFPVVTHYNSEDEDKRITGLDLAEFLKSVEWKESQTVPDGLPDLSVDLLTSTSFLHLYPADTGIAAIQVGSEMRYYTISKNEYIALRSLCYIYAPTPEPEPEQDDVITGTPTVGIPRETLLSFCGRAPDISFDALADYDYYPTEAKHITRDYFTAMPGFYLRASARTENRTINDMKLIYFGGEYAHAGFFETFDLSDHESDYIDTVLNEYPEYIAGFTTLDDWHSDELTSKLPKPDFGNTLGCWRFYQDPKTRSVQMDGVSHDEVDAYIRKIEEAGLKLLAYDKENGGPHQMTTTGDGQVISGTPLLRTNAALEGKGIGVSISHMGDAMSMAVTVVE